MAGENQPLLRKSLLKKIIDRLEFLNPVVLQLRGQLHRAKDIFSGAHDIYADLIGVDVEASSILFALIKSQFGQLKLSSVSLCPVPIGMIREDSIVNPQALDKTLKAFIAKQGSMGTQSSIAIPGSKILIKKIKLENLVNSIEAEGIAWQEATKAFPGLVKNLFLDFSLSNEASSTGGKSEPYLTLVIARKEDVVPRVYALKEIGITTKVADLDHEALGRAYRRLLAPQLPPGHEEKNIAVLNFDPHSFLLVVMQHNAIRYFNRHVYAGDYIISAMFTAFGLQYSSYTTTNPAVSKPEVETAETLPQEKSLITSEQSEQIAEHVRRLLQYFYSEFSGETIHQIVLTGRCSLIPGIKEHIQARLSIPTVVINPFERLIKDSKISAETYALGPAFVLSCGLSLRGVTGWK